MDNAILGQFEGQNDIGPVKLVGTCEYEVEQQVYTITSTGTNVGEDQDEFHFVWKRMRGNFILSMRASWKGPGINQQRMFGWMARTSLEPGSPMVCTGTHADGQLSLHFRRTIGVPVEELQVSLLGADVIQLERKDDTYSMSVACFGEPFSTVQVCGIELGEVVYVGLFVCSNDQDVLEQAIFQDVRIVVPVKEGFVRGRDPFGSLLEILDLESGHRRIIYSSQDVFEAPNWTRDGQALIFNRDGRLVRFNLASGTRTLIDTGHILRNNNDHVLSFDGSRLGISSHGGARNASRVYTLPVQGGIPKLVTPKGPSYLHGWSPDGKFLVYCAERNGEYDIFRISISGGEEIRLTDAIGLNDGPEYTPDGRFIYFNSVRSGRNQIWRMAPDGSQQEQMTDDEYNNWFPHISLDEKWVVFVSYLVGEVEPGDHPPAKRVYLRMIPMEGGTPRVLAYLYGGQGSMNVPSWSPDSRQLAFVSNTVPYE